MYAFPSTTSTWVLTDEKLHDDIFIMFGDVNTVCISASVFKYATPMSATSDGVQGVVSSQRLYHALTRYATRNGEDIAYIDAFLKEKYGCSIIVDDYAELTKYTTGETDASFEQFKPEELLAILTAFAEMPVEYEKVNNLKYLIRRIDGTDHPLYPDSAAVSWTMNNGYIEFMDSTFMGDLYNTTYRLIIHEKAHFIWDTLTTEQKNEWIKIGDWTQTLDGWKTTQETQFVSAYAHDHDPEEDFAESVAYYVVNSNKFKSVAEDKYNFVRTEVMYSQEYFLQIDENMQFEVYNSYPDYNLPGHISGVEVNVTGLASEDKIVKVTLNINTNDDPTFGAEKAFIRLVAPDGVFQDMWLYATDDTNSTLTGTVTISKYCATGGWITNGIQLVDTTGNKRMCNTESYGWELQILNALYDHINPEHVPGSVTIEHERGVFENEEVTFVHVKFKAFDNVGIRTVYCELVNETTNGYRLAEYGTFNNETGEAVVTFVFPDHMANGTYVVSHLSMIDYAENRGQIYFNKYTYPATFEFTSVNADMTAPTLDLNNITVSAQPMRPNDPNGETKLTLEYFANDDISGVDMVSFKLIDPTGKTHFFYHYHDNFYTTFFVGDPTKSKKYMAEVILPIGSAPGTWGVLEMMLTDKAGNTVKYNFAEIVHFSVTE